LLDCEADTKRATGASRCVLEVAPREWGRTEQRIERGRDGWLRQHHGAPSVQLPNHAKSRHASSWTTQEVVSTCVDGRSPVARMRTRRHMRDRDVLLFSCVLAIVACSSKDASPPPSIPPNDTGSEVVADEGDDAPVEASPPIGPAGKFPIKVRIDGV